MTIGPMNQFDLILRRVKRRNRRVNTIRFSILFGVASLVLTLPYLMVVYLGYLESVDLFSVIFGNLGVTVAGALWGYFKPIDMAEALYRADRRLGLDERLSTLYDLRHEPSQSQRKHGAFLTILSQQVAGLHVEPKRAFSPSQNDRIRVITLGLLLLLLGGLLGMIYGDLRFGGGALADGLNTGRLVPGDRMEESFEFQSLVEPGERGSGLRQPNTNQQNRTPTTPQPQQPQESNPQPGGPGNQPLNQALAELYGIDADRSSIGDESLLDELIEQQREAMERLQEFLDEIEEQLRSGEEMTQQQREALEELFPQLQDPELREQIQQMLNSQDSQRQLELGEQIQDDISGRQEQEQNLLASPQLDPSAPSPPDAPQGDQREQPQNDSSGEPAEQTSPGSDNSTQGDQPTEVNMRGLEPREGEAGEQQIPARSDDPGIEAGETLDTRPITEERGIFDVEIPGIFSEDGPRRQMLTRGVPIEGEALPQPETGVPPISYDKVESILDLREIPDELRQVVRDYFVRITTDPEP